MAAPASVHFPTQPPANPAGQKGPRAEILVALKRANRLTARELSQQQRLSLNAVRHHLKELEVEGLVVHEREQRGVGAPVFSYRLAPLAESLFPRRYEGALAEVLDQVVEREGRAEAVSLLRSVHIGLARRLEQDMVGRELPERLAAVAQALSAEGYMADAELTPEGGILTEHNCPLRAVVERFPEICDAEAELLEAALAVPVERTSHMLAGCGCCQYSVGTAHASPLTESRTP